MSKGMIYSAIGAVGVGTLTFLLMNPKDKRQEAERAHEDLPVRKAGLPEEDDLENAKMVSEGSQFGVHYYNQLGRD